MPSPFPGMDPYLEAAQYWQPFHDRLVFHLGSVLQESLPPGYVADFAQRVEIVLAARDIVPDVAVTHTSAGTGVVAVSTAASADPATLIAVRTEEVVERYVQVLRIPEGTVKSSLHRGRVRALEVLEERGQRP